MSPVHYNGMAGRRVNAPGRGHPRLDGDDMKDDTRDVRERSTPSEARSRDERFDAKWMPEPNTGCWLWTAATQGNGYGKFTVEGKQVYAHRHAFERWVGPIPTGLTIDHLCRVRNCVNPDHLEPVTHRENLLRGETINAANAAKTHCVRGHEFTPGNTYVYRDGRYCRTCHADAEARRYRARKAAA